MSTKSSNRMQATICAVLAAVGLFAQVTFADPAETTTLTLRRAVEQGNRLEGKLSKNVYKQEAYQANYTEEVPYQTTETYVEQIPYQTTETYTVQVPYQREEAYTDYETYYTSEHQCTTKYENKCAYERECHTVSRPECHTVSGSTQCRTVEECGTNALGEPICKQRQVCETGPSQQQCNNVSTNVCNQEYRCNQVPTQQCGYVQVPHQRAVTKYRTVTDYRSETHTREVTKYNSVTKTRVVTKYRTETKCCVTKYRQVFDKQKVVDVEVLFPASATLVAGEVEKIKITLAAADAQADVKLEVLESVYGYKILNQNATETSVRIELDLAPKFSAADVGEATIESLMLVGTPGQLAVAFTDKGIKNKITTQYTLKILDPNGAVVSEQVVVSTGAAKVQIPIGLLDPQVKHDAELSVHREGLVLAAPVDFVKTQKALGSLEATPFADATQVGKFGLSGNKAATSLAFRDISPRHESVSTEYQIAIVVGGQQIAAATVQRDKLPVAQGGIIVLGLVKNLGLSAEVANAQLKSGKAVVINIAVVRSGPFSSGPQIVISKSVSLSVP